MIPFLFIENLWPYFLLERCHGCWYYRHNNLLTRKWGAASLLITGVEFLNTRQPLLIIHTWHTGAISNLGVSMVPGCLSFCLRHHRSSKALKSKGPRLFVHWGSVSALLYATAQSTGYDPSNSGNGLGTSRVSNKLTNSSQTSSESPLADRHTGLKPRSNETHNHWLTGRLCLTHTVVTLSRGEQDIHRKCKICVRTLQVDLIIGFYQVVFLKKAVR